MHKPERIISNQATQGFRESAATSRVASLLRLSTTLDARRRRFALVAIAPVIGVFVYLRVIPIAQSLNMSFNRWPLVGGSVEFVGLENYIQLLRDPNFIEALRNTVLFAVVTTVASVMFALAVAATLARPLGRLARPLLETSYFLPVLLALVPVTLAWRIMFDYQTGVVNEVLGWMGVSPVAWLTNPTAAFGAIVIISTWKQVAYNGILLLVGIRAIPEMYNEAAAIDGASSWQGFRYVTLPLLMPIVLFVTVITTISAFNVFTQVYVLASDTQGAPGHLVRVLVYDIFENGFRFGRMGYASAEAGYLLAIVLGLTAVQFWLVGRRGSWRE